MKRKKAAAFILCASLTSGMAVPVMAAEIPEGETGIQITDILSPQEESAPEDMETTPEHMISDAMIASMSKSLTFLIEQTEQKVYPNAPDRTECVLDENGMEYLNGMLQDVYEEDFDSLIASMKDAVTEENIKEAIRDIESAEEKNRTLETLENQVVYTVNTIKNRIDEAMCLIEDEHGNTDEIGMYQLFLKRFYKQVYQQAYMDPVVYTEEYVEKLKAELVEIEALQELLENVQKQGDEEQIKEAIQKVDAAAEPMNYLLNAGDSYLDKGIYVKAISQVKAYSTFSKFVPEYLLEENVIGSMTGRCTYGKMAEYASTLVSYLEEHLAKIGNGLTTDEMKKDCNDIGNVQAAYDGVTRAILDDAAAQAECAELVGYIGAEKDAYETALADYQSVYTNKEYEKYADAAGALIPAAKAYKEAAGKDGVKRIREFSEKVKMVDAYVQGHITYFTEEYAQQLHTAAEELGKAAEDTSALAFEKMSELLKLADSVLNGARAESSYTEKMKTLVWNVQSGSEEIRVWLRLASEEGKNELPEFPTARLAAGLEGKYSEAEALAVQMENALNQTPDSYTMDIDELEKAYQSYAEDLKKPDGIIQTMAKEISGEILKAAENLYQQEKGKKHTEETLKAFRTEIENLKKVLQSWDYNQAKEAVENIMKAKSALLNDKVKEDGTPQNPIEFPEPEKPSEEKNPTNPDNPSDGEKPQNPDNPSDGEKPQNPGNLSDEKSPQKLMPQSRPEPNPQVIVKPQSPKTGDLSAVGNLLAMLGLSGGAAAVGYRRKKIR